MKLNPNIIFPKSKIQRLDRIKENCLRLEVKDDKIIPVLHEKNTC